MTIKPGDERPVGYVRSLVELLAELRARAGDPSYREIAGRIPSHTGECTSHGYISEVLRGKRIPSGDMAAAIVHALGGDRNSQNRARRYAEEAASDRATTGTMLVDEAVPIECPPKPRQLPLAVRDFIGRAEQMNVLDSLLDDGTDRAGTSTQGAVVISVLHGMAGVGKTALAVHWAHRVQHHFPDGTLFVNLRGYDSGEPASPGEVLSGFLQALGTPPEHVPIGVAAQAALYRSVLSGRRVLIVLDNANSAEQARPLLPGAARCLVLVTSRTILTGLVSSHAASVLLLDPMEPDEAIELVHRILGPRRVAAEADAVIELTRICARLPLALRIAAARIATRPRLTASNVVTEIADDQLRLDALSIPGDETAVRVAFDGSYRRLPADLARMFRRLGLHPTPEISIQAAAAAAGVDAVQARHLLDGLAETHLIEPVARNRFRIHDLLHVYAAECAIRDEDPHACARVRVTLLGWYAHTAKRACDLVFPGILRLPLELGSPSVPPLELTADAQALTWLDTERENLVSAVRNAADHELLHLAMHLVDAINVFLMCRAYRDDLFDVFAVAVAAARRIGDRTCEAWFLLVSGWVRSQISQWEDARDPLRRALTLAEDLHDTLLHAWTLTALGWGCWGQGRYAEALDYLRPALRESQSVDDGGRLESIVEQRLSRIYLSLGDYQVALTHAERCLALRAGASDLEGDTYALHQLALVWQHLGDHQKVIDLCTQAIISARKCAGFPPRIATTLDTLATSLLHTGDHAWAVACWREALEIFDRFADYRADTLRDRLHALQATDSQNQ